MKKQILFGIVVIISLSLVAMMPSKSIQERTCAEAKLGKFSIVDKSFNHRSEIYRYDKKQMEVNLGTNDTIFQNIEWLNDCTYTLETIGDESHKPDRLRGLKLVVTIDSIVSKKHYYTVHPETMEHLKINFKMTKLE